MLLDKSKEDNTFYIIYSKEKLLQDTIWIRQEEYNLRLSKDNLTQELITEADDINLI